MRQFTIIIAAIFIVLLVPSKARAADPYGWLDAADCNSFRGWTCDPDNFNQSIDVHFYTDDGGVSNKIIGTMTANEPSDAGVIAACGNVGTGHRFTFTTPDWLKSGTSRNIYGYGINIGGGTNTQLSGSPKAFNCTGTRNAQYISQTCPPSSMTPNQSASVSVTMKNTGNLTWTTGGNYNLGSQNLQDNGTWGTGRVSVGSNIAPNTSKIFSFNATAPATQGTYNFQWKMLQESVTWFGDTTPNCSINVSCPAAQSCPTICHTDTQYVPNGSCGQTTCPPNAPVVQSCPTSCHTDTQYVSNGSCGQTTCEPNALAAQTVPSCRTSGGSVPDGACGTTTYTANCFSPNTCVSGSCTPPSAPTTSCGSGTARSTGLVSAPDVTNFNTSGACVSDSKASFAPYKIPSFDDLKSMYYIQSKAEKITSTSTNLSPITSSDNGKVFTYTAPDVNINGTYNYNGTVVIFLDGDININKNIIAGDPTQGLVLVVKEDVNIDKDVTRIDAVIISGGIINTAVNGGATALQLTINGSLISLTDTKPIQFRRNLADNSQPAELIQSQPKYLVILKDLFADTSQKWLEIP